MQTYNDVTDINLPLKVAPHWAIMELTLSRSVLRESENRKKMKNQHIDGALFFPIFTARRCSGFVIKCRQSGLEYIIICLYTLKIGALSILYIGFLFFNCISLYVHVIMQLHNGPALLSCGN